MSLRLLRKTLSTGPLGVVLALLLLSLPHDMGATAARTRQISGQRATSARGRRSAGRAGSLRHSEEDGSAAPAPPPPAPKQPEGMPSYSLSVNVPAVTVDAIVLSKDGQFIPGLKQENFRVLEDGVPQQITSFGQTPGADYRRSADRVCQQQLHDGVSGRRAACGLRFRRRSQEKTIGSR